MSPKAPAKMDVHSAWKAWMTSGSPEAAVEFLGRVGPWTEGTAAQLTRGGARRDRPWLTREEVAQRLRHQLGVVAGGESVTYMEALDRARRKVIAELLRPPLG
jgi:hypothetical protein